MQKESRKWMSEEQHQDMLQHYFINRPFSAFHTQYSNIPLFHHSIWPQNTMDAKKMDSCKNSETINQKKGRIAYGVKMGTQPKRGT